MFRPQKAVAAVLLCALTISIFAPPASATRTTMHSLTGAYADGALPVGALANISGTLYGVTRNGVGGYGSLYKLYTTGGTHTILDFDGSANSPRNPESGPIAVGFVLYGTSPGGGTNGQGMIYSITTGGTVNTPLHSFANTATDGGYPIGGLTLDSSGTVFYGTTVYGGANGVGTIYSINVNGSNFKTIHSFDSAVEASYPYTALCEAPDHSLLYGTSLYCAGGNGCLYSITKDGLGVGYQVVHVFTPTDHFGNSPLCDLVKGTDNRLYGTCLLGGDGGLGTVFRWDFLQGLDGVGSFNGYNGATPGSNFGSYPQYRLTAGTGGVLYGVSRAGGMNGLGTIFKVNVQTLSSIIPLASFTQTTSNGYPNPLTLIGTTLYGTSYYGGISAVGGPGGSPQGTGSAFSCTATGTLKSLHDFYVQDGYNPRDSPTVAISNYLYGTAIYGGLYGSGMIYKVNTTLPFAYSVLHSFNDFLKEGISPAGGLYKAADGALYGCTSSGGNYAYGTIYKITTTGVFSVIHHFQSYEGIDMGRKLVQGYGSDKNLYGVCFQGGAGNAGSIFKVSTAGVFSIIHHFTNLDGRFPGSQLTAEPDTTHSTTKWLYGVTYQGGDNGLGVLFNVNQTGSSFSVLHSFAGGSDGANPAYNNGGPMYLNSSGILYGTTSGGVFATQDTIWSYNIPLGLYNTVYSFINSAGDGYFPVGGLVSDGSGNLYGANQNGGLNTDYGTVWKYNIAGNTLTVLHTFMGTSVDGDGGHPQGVVFDPSGLLYGATVDNGSDTNGGTVFSQTLSP